MPFRISSCWRWAVIVPAGALLLTLPGCDVPSGEGEADAKDGDAISDPIATPAVNRGETPRGEGPGAVDLPVDASEPPSDTSTLGSAEQLQVVEAVATILGDAPGSIDLDQPILNPGRNVEEFDLLEILIELEDRFDVEIDEAAIERASGGRFDEIQKRLTPRQLFGIVAEAVGAKE